MKLVYEKSSQYVNVAIIDELFCI